MPLGSYPLHWARTHNGSDPYNKVPDNIHLRILSDSRSIRNYTCWFLCIPVPGNPWYRLQKNNLSPLCKIPDLSLSDNSVHPEDPVCTALWNRSAAYKKQLCSFPQNLLPGQPLHKPPSAPESDLQVCLSFSKPHDLHRWSRLQISHSPEALLPETLLPPFSL